jgi:hypothetical protein
VKWTSGATRLADGQRRRHREVNGNLKLSPLSQTPRTQQTLLALATRWHDQRARPAEPGNQAAGRRADAAAAAEPEAEVLDKES